MRRFVYLAAGFVLIAAVLSLLEDEPAILSSIEAAGQEH